MISVILYCLSACRTGSILNFIDNRVMGGVE